MNFMCRMSGYDDADEWHQIEAIDAEHAAETYASICDDNSAGELYTAPLEDGHLIEVKSVATGTLSKFNVEFDFSKIYIARNAA